MPLRCPTVKSAPDRVGFISIASVIILALLSVSFLHGEENFPPPRGAVNDFAGVIPSPYVNQMESLAREVLEKTGTTVVVAAMETVGNDTPDDYANRLYSAWGIGKKGEDKGVLIFLAVKERKIRIETGYGVEGILPDGLVGEILDGYVTPYLKTGDYGKGLANAMIAVSSVIAKAADVSLTGNPAISQPATKRVRRSGSLFPLLLLLLLILIPLLATRQGRAMLPFLLLMFLSGGGRGGGGGFGSFGGGFGGFGGGSSGGGGGGRGF
ncbi:MAG: TPM domain-containing protein [Syntrophales bacterium]|nr:TPM domain-containing protein [Syntrophales bacterium]